MNLAPGSVGAAVAARAGDGSTPDGAAPSLCGCRELSQSFGRQAVFAGCDLDVAPGQVVGLAGENGSGKSTLVRCLLGLLRPTAGRVWCDPQVGYCPQENILHRSYTVAEHFGFVGSLRRDGQAPDPDYLEHCTQTLKLTRHLRTPIGKLSGGTYQKVKLLTALLHRPRLLVLDEPTDGFDWTMYLVFWNLVGELVARGSGVLLVSHLLHDRARFDRIVELREGRLHG